MRGAFGYEGKFFNAHQVKIACFFNMYLDPCHGIIPNSY